MFSFRTISWVLTTLIPVSAAVGFVYGSWHESDKKNGPYESLDTSPATATPDYFNDAPHVATPEVWWS